jgi:hypothetical protein
VGRTRRRPARRDVDGVDLERVRGRVRGRDDERRARRGYGEALTWAATRCRTDLPSTLQASSMGRPIYERMGFRTVASFTVWERER